MLHLDTINLASRKSLYYRLAIDEVYIIAMMLTTVREGPGAAGLPVPLVRVLEEVGLYFDAIDKKNECKRLASSP